MLHAQFSIVLLTHQLWICACVSVGSSGPHTGRPAGLNGYSLKVRTRTVPTGSVVNISIDLSVQTCVKRNVLADAAKAQP